VCRSTFTHTPRLSTACLTRPGQTSWEPATCLRRADWASCCERSGRSGCALRHTPVWRARAIRRASPTVSVTRSLCRGASTARCVWCVTRLGARKRINRRGIQWTCNWLKQRLPRLCRENAMIVDKLARRRLVQACREGGVQRYAGELQRWSESGAASCV